MRFAESEIRAAGIEPVNMHMIASDSRRFHSVGILALGLTLYTCAFGILLRNKNFEPAEATVVLIVFGVVFPLLGWAATRRTLPLSISVRPSTRALIALTAYVILLSLYLVAGQQWIDQQLPHS